MKKILAQLLLWSIASLSAFAQVPTGRLSGSVVDASGAAVPNATVNLLITGGESPIVSTTTNAEGIFNFPALRAQAYDLNVESQGFNKVVLREVRVNAAQELQLPAIKMEVAAAAQTIEVAADVQAVQLANSENSTTITQQQIQSLPVLDRQVSTLFQTQAGVASGRGPTVINGLRTSAANVTLDGINIQDNFIRTNSLDYIPTRTTIEQVAEATITTSNAASAQGLGANQIVLSTPSGTNTYSGSLYWYNRNSYFAANDWFNNQAGVDRAQLNQNQLGGSLRGRIIRDKLFFFFNYEALRLRQGTSVTRTVLTPEARQGIFRYRDTGGQVRSVNILQLGGSRNTTIDPYIANILGALPTTINSPTTGDGLNTGGYAFNARDNTDRNAILTRIDYYLNERNSFTGTYTWNTDVVDRPDLGSFVTAVPPVFNDNKNNLMSLAWRSAISPSFINELRGGFNLAPGSFAVRDEYASVLPSTTTNAALIANLYASPFNTFLAQGRDTNTYQIQDNVNWIKGKHSIQFGFQSQFIRTAPYNDGGIVPQYSLGFSAANPNGVQLTDLPGGRSQDLTQANNLLAGLAGYVTSVQQTFNVNSRDAGYERGAPNIRHFAYDNYAGYIQDNWKVDPRLTINVGLRWDYFTRLNERDSLILLPRLEGGLIPTLMNPNAVLDFAGNSVNRPYYRKDLNNLAPNFGFAWDVFGNGKTALRGGYSISYINDDTITAVRNNINTNSGLITTIQVPNLNARIGSNPPAVPVPDFKLPRTAADNYALSTGSAIGLPDPDLRSPMVHQWTLSLQHEIWNTIFEARYVGNRAADLLRAYDYNQVNIYAGGFYEDFLRARSNGFLALNAGQGFNPAYNPSLPGSQQLTLIPTFASGGSLTSAAVRQEIQQGEVGSLADRYQQNRAVAPGFFYPNPAALAANTISNSGYSLYNALQLDVRRRLRAGMQVQANYTFSKVLSNTIGNDQARFEPFLDINNPSLENARAPFDIRHIIKANYVVELPFGAGRRWSGNRFTNTVLGGWMLGGIINWQSGTPFSVFSNRGTLNRGARSTEKNTASIAGISGSDLFDQVGGVWMTPNGPRFVNPSIIDPAGRGTSGDGQAAFNGQIFYNPDPGTVGNTQRRMFSGPWTFNWDASVLKRFHVTERQYVEFRAEAFNVLNTPQFWVGNETSSTTRFNINSTTFGVINSTLNSSRIMQFGLYYRF